MDQNPEIFGKPDKAGSWKDEVGEDDILSKDELDKFSTAIELMKNPESEEVNQKIFDMVMEAGGPKALAEVMGQEVVDSMVNNFRAACDEAGVNDGAKELGSRFYTEGHGEANWMEKPTEATGRPEGDDRSADDIINANPALKNLGDQKDIKRDELKELCGDWTSDNPDPEARADAAYNMSKVLNYIDNLAMNGGANRENAADGDIHGITSDGDARHGTEAGILKDFAEQGFGSLPDGELVKSNDDQVKADGSNYDNFQYACKEVADVINKIPIVRHTWGNILEGMSQGNDFGEVVLGGAMGAAEGAMTIGSALVRGGPVGLAAFAVADTIDTGLNNAGIDNPLGNIPLVGGMIAPGSAQGMGSEGEHSAREFGGTDAMLANFQQVGGLVGMIPGVNDETA